MRHILRWIVILAVPLVLTIAIARLLTMPWYVTAEYSRPGFPADPYGMPAEVRLRLAQATIRFLNVRGNSVDLSTLQLSDGTQAYNQRELAHMDDVKQVYDMLTLVAAGALVLGVMSAWGLSFTEGRREVWRALAWGGGLTLSILAVLGVWMLIDFERFFDLFHGVFFRAGTWVFYTSDTLIRLFPLPLWRDAGLIIAGAVSLVSVALLVLGLRVARSTAA